MPAHSNSPVTYGKSAVLWHANSLFLLSATLLARPARAELCETSTAQCAAGQQVVATTLHCPILVGATAKVDGSDTFEFLSSEQSVNLKDTLIVDCKQTITCDL